MDLIHYDARNVSAKETWQRIQEDDPSLDDIVLSFTSNRAPRSLYRFADADLAQLGRDIGRNTNLKKVELDGDAHSDDQDSTNAALDRLRTICEGMNQNQSIITLNIFQAGCRFVACAARELSPFLENNEQLEDVASYFCRFDVESARQLVAPIARRNKPLASFQLKFYRIKMINSKSFGNIIGAFLEKPDRTPLNFGLGSDVDQSSTKLMKINELLKKPNCTMKDLKFRYTRGSWKKISQSLCDVSSINATYYSNHTLETIDADRNRPFQPCLEQSLKLNQNPDKKLVALQKVALCHFGDKFEIGPFIGWPPDLSLRVIEFLDIAATQKDNEGNTIINIKSSNRLSLLFQLIRDNPLVCAKGGEGESSEGALVGDALGSTDIEPECNLCKRQRLL